MKCSEIQEEAALLASGDDPRAAEAEAHAAQCDECAKALEEAHAVWDILAVSPSAPSDADRARARVVIRAERRWDRFVGMFGHGLGLLLVLVGVSLAMALTADHDHGLDSAGWHCALIETLYAAVPLSFLALSVARGWFMPNDVTPTTRQRVAIVSLTTAGALAGQLFLIVGCSMPGAAHALVWHTAPLCALLAVAWLVTRKTFWARRP